MSDFINKLAPDFVAELVKACLINSKILNICREHLKWQFLETESQKKTLRYVFDYADVNMGKVPTVGMLGQTFGTDKDVLKFLTNIKKAEIARENEMILLDTLEDFIKKRRLIILHQDSFPKLYNEGKHNEALNLLAEESDAISKFSLRQTYFDTIFGDFDERQAERERIGKNNLAKEKSPYGIHELDDIMHGGGSVGTSSLFLARSGVGKTLLGRWIGLSNARIGRRVVHFFAEGTKKEQKDAYDAAWTSVAMREIEYGNIPDELRKDISRIRRHIMANGGEIIVIVAESFDSMYIEDCYEIIKEIERTVGKVHEAIFDYLEEFAVKGKFSGESGERNRRLKIANKITNIATELKLHSVAFTQANDIKFDKWNNPEYVLTRSDISEFKGLIKPFSLFATLNQTMDEYKNQIMRLFIDKLRQYQSGQTINIYQSRENARFYDSAKTLDLFYKKV